MDAVTLQQSERTPRALATAPALGDRGSVPAVDVPAGRRSQPGSACGLRLRASAPSGSQGARAGPPARAPGCRTASPVARAALPSSGHRWRACGCFPFLTINSHAAVNTQDRLSRGCKVPGPRASTWARRCWSHRPAPQSVRAGPRPPAVRARPRGCACAPRGCACASPRPCVRVPAALLPPVPTPRRWGGKRALPEVGRAFPW